MRLPEGYFFFEVNMLNAVKVQIGIGNSQKCWHCLTHQYAVSQCTHERSVDLGNQPL